MRYPHISKSALLAGIAAALGAGVTFAYDYTEEAPVVSSTPIVERINTPAQHCWNETVTTQEYRGGAVLGGFVGYSAPVEQTVQRCNKVDNYREEIRGYDVVYFYNGHNVHTRLPYDPGSTVHLNVNMVR